MVSSQPIKVGSQEIQEATTYDHLVQHAFVKRALKDGATVLTDIGAKCLSFANNKSERDPDEHEFYILSIGHTLSQFLTWCQQMSHTVLYLSAFSPTEKMKRNGITRINHLLYTIENYIIRTQSVYDRILMLVNSVFHLHSAPEDCSHSAIVNNAHVRRTAVSSKLKAIKKLLRKYHYVRNSIVHHQSYQDDDVRYLEALTILNGETCSGSVGLATNANSRQNQIKNMTRVIVRHKIGEFDTFNRKLIMLFNSLFDELETRYGNQEARLRLLCDNKPPITHRRN